MPRDALELERIHNKCLHPALDPLESGKIRRHVPPWPCDEIVVP